MNDLLLMDCYISIPIGDVFFKVGDITNIIIIRDCYAESDSMYIQGNRVFGYGDV